MREADARQAGEAVQNTPSSLSLLPPPLTTAITPLFLITQQVMGPVPSGGTHNTAGEPCNTRQDRRTAQDRTGDDVQGRARDGCTAPLRRVAGKAPAACVARNPEGDQATQRRATADGVTHSITFHHVDDVLVGVSEIID